VCRALRRPGFLETAAQVDPSSSGAHAHVLVQRRASLLRCEERERTDGLRQRDMCRQRSFVEATSCGALAASVQLPVQG
jgi:hypothetical protein